MQKVYTLVIAGLLLLSGHSYAQNYFVSAKTLHLRNDHNTNAEILKDLKYCDNVMVLEDSLNTTGWVKVKLENVSGYVSDKYLKKGSCQKHVYSYRVGAVCNDGSSSSATGRGACSHHGGVQYWRTREQVDYTITDE